MSKSEHKNEFKIRGLKYTHRKFIQGRWIEKKGVEIFRDGKFYMIMWVQHTYY